MYVLIMLVVLGGSEKVMFVPDLSRDECRALEYLVEQDGGKAFCDEQSKEI